MCSAVAYYFSERYYEESGKKHNLEKLKCAINEAIKNQAHIARAAAARALPTMLG